MKHCEHDYIVKEYVDIKGVRLIFKILKDKIDLSKKELMDEMRKNAGVCSRKIRELEKNLNENYYTKTEIDTMMPEGIPERTIERIYDRVNR